MNAAVFLDRDNTLIHNDGDLGDPDKVRLMQGAATAVASLCGLGYKVVVITNQGGVARGKYTEEDVDAVHEKLSALLAAGANGAKIDRYYFCPYHPQGTVSRYRKEHPNRKPSPGMLQEAARDLGLDLSQSWTIGDQVRDVQAGLAVGTRAILLRLDADRLRPFDPREHPGLNDDAEDGSDEPKATPDFYARNLVEAVRIVAQQRKPETSEHIHRSGPTQRKWDAAAVAKLQRERTKPSGNAGGAGGGDVEAGEKGAAGSGAGTKPFRPWNVPTAELDDREDGGTTDLATDARQAVAPAVAVQAVPSKPASAEGAVRDATGDNSEWASRDAPRGLSRGASAGTSGGGEASDEKTLRLILQELRNQRGMGTEFSYTRIMAIVLQTVAGACFLGAFWLGGADGALFLKLIGSAIVVQLAVIAALLWER